METKTTQIQTTMKKKSSIEKAQEYLFEKYDIQFNTINNTVFYKEKVSLKGFTEVNENDLFLELNMKGIKTSMNTLMSILNSSMIPKYNPFKNYFMSVENLWDRSKHGDIIEKLAIYLVTDDQQRLNKHFKKMLVRSVACSIEPSVFNKQAFILVSSQQNSGKSSFCRWLCPPKLTEYFTENIGLDKDSQIALCENFIINLDELATLSKADINGLKSIFSMSSVKTRPPYGRKAIKMIRRANFVGSTNRLEFLHDETGNVRWLCFNIQKIDWKYRADFDIDRVWSQAYQLYKENFNYNLTEDEIRKNENANEQFIETTTEFEMLLETVQPGTAENHTNFLTTTQIRSLLIEQSNFHERPNKIQLGKALIRLGFIQTQKYNSEKKYPIKGYYVNVINS